MNREGGREERGKKEIGFQRPVNRDDYIRAS